MPLLDLLAVLDLEEAVLEGMSEGGDGWLLFCKLREFGGLKDAVLEREEDRVGEAAFLELRRNLL